MRLRARDDRGKSIRLRLALVTPVDASDAARPLVVRWWRRLPEVVVPPALFAAGILVLISLALREGPAVVAVTLFSPVSSSLIFVSIALLLLMNRAAARHVARTREAFKSRRRCPACRYDLAGLEPENDHCTPCPECGAAWDLREKQGTELVVIRADGSASSPTATTR